MNLIWFHTCCFVLPFILNDIWALASIVTQLPSQVTNGYTLTIANYWMRSFMINYNSLRHQPFHNTGCDVHALQIFFLLMSVENNFFHTSGRSSFFLYIQEAKTIFQRFFVYKRFTTKFKHIFIKRRLVELKLYKKRRAVVACSYGSWIYNYIFVPMQSVPITTDVVSSNLDQSKVYNIMW